MSSDASKPPMSSAARSADGASLRNVRYFRWAENERNEVRNTTAIQSGPAQDGQLPLIRAARARIESSFSLDQLVARLQAKYDVTVDRNAMSQALAF